MLFSGTRAPTALILALLLMRPTFGAAQRVDSSAQDIGWPRQVVRNGATLTYYQPQIDEWRDHKELLGRLALRHSSP